MLRDKFTITTEPVPGGRFVLLTAVASEAAPSAARAVLHRSHGVLGNVWREALVAQARAKGRTLTKNEARERRSPGPSPAPASWPGRSSTCPATSWPR